MIARIKTSHLSKGSLQFSSPPSFLPKGQLNFKKERKNETERKNYNILTPGDQAEALGTWQAIGLAWLGKDNTR